MKKAVIYSRFSPRPNADECRSIEKQVAKCKEYCEANGYKVAGVFEDKAMSGGRADNRPQLQKALKLCCKEKAVMVVYSLSRLARNTKDAITIAEQLSQAKANLVSLNEQIDTTTAMGRAFFKFLAVLAELERELNAERTQAAMLYYQQSGRRMSDRTPYGFAVDPDDPTRIIRHEQEWDNIQEIKRLRKRGWSLKEICNELVAQGRTPRKKYQIGTDGARIQNKDGSYRMVPGTWNAVLIMRILRREVM